ncbi:hypothetical protein IMG5_156090 [Ichthyophthirius multifiliis]|uniref:Uncharacterized protein n=1 Tax=Ichthyophthirius multifiliis TaxID=5932 RepID=G0QZE7_ICHMU|nr:hypothetical protein IMG5_156090 [Ichthyophthirius multifiliis]EGR29416.1 hypothetical protein IMG5_156090 [Ichthyophthirius multifiliis]|eukprot:XP_004030652.1 hypothetical protein IMG5_156090 [Ichthyophthirius multifiliis]
MAQLQNFRRNPNESLIDRLKEYISEYKLIIFLTISIIVLFFYGNYARKDDELEHKIVPNQIDFIQQKTEYFTSIFDFQQGSINIQNIFNEQIEKHFKPIDQTIFDFYIDEQLTDKEKSNDLLKLVENILQTIKHASTINEYMKNTNSTINKNNKLLDDCKINIIDKNNNDMVSFANEFLDQNKHISEIESERDKLRDKINKLTEQKNENVNQLREQIREKNDTRASYLQYIEIQQNLDREIQNLQIQWTKNNQTIEELELEIQNLEDEKQFIIKKHEINLESYRRY